jgi:hypothetical protein
VVSILYQYGSQLLSQLTEDRAKTEVSATAEKAAAKQTSAKATHKTTAEKNLRNGYYYRKLDEDGQELYEEILQGVQDEETVIEVEETDAAVIQNVYQFLLYDCPELFWCTGEMTITSYTFYSELEPVYEWTGEALEKRRAKLEQAAEQCLSGIEADASDYRCVKYVFQYLVDNVDYDLSAKHNQTVYSALVGGKTVCAGYSRAAQYLLQKLGITCIYVTGTANGSDHAWNIVKCDGSYYQMDVTFGDPTFSKESAAQSNINYAYLCCTDEEIYRNHTPSTVVSLPECSARDLNYYALRDSLYESYDSDVVLAAMKQSVDEGSDSYGCQFTTEEAYQSAKSDIIDRLMPEAAQALAEQYGLSRAQYSYVADDTFYTITVYWNYNEE